MVYRQAALDSTFAALADPTRRAILARLANGDRTISELASRFAMSLPAVSKHVRVLERAGLARVRREGRARRTTLVAAPMRDAAAWMERYRRFWEFQLDQLTAYLATADDEPAAARLTSTPTGEENQWPRPRKQRTSAPRRSRSDASSPPPASASSTRGRKRKSSTAGARRRR
ncbi:MAG TPA: metalloregulator ArsR/SmtB family transcription factor [Gemmatimonadaceae bacterium]|nr:metalloregulator ArsR/SmtB family transcription factor [Gemmatimonadaceae bacterium]